MFHYILWLQNDIVEGILFHVVILSMIIKNLDMNTKDKINRMLAEHC